MILSLFKGNFISWEISGGGKRKMQEELVNNYVCFNPWGNPLGLNAVLNECLPLNNHFTIAPIFSCLKIITHIKVNFLCPTFIHFVSNSIYAT